MSWIAPPLVGIVVGFLEAVGVGPLNIAVMRDALRGKARTAVAMIVGGTLGDAVYCSVAMLGLSQLFVITLERLLLRLLFGIGIVVYGGIMFLSSSKIRRGDSAPPARLSQMHGSFWVGMLLTILNPGLLVTWALTAGTIHAYGIIGESLRDNLLFAAGAGVGMALWLHLLLLLLVKNRRRIPFGAMHRIVQGFGLLLIGFGIYCMFGLGLER